MKKLFILPLLILMTGCVTYYLPDTALEDGVYYAEDDPSYIFNSGDYSGVVYYPWSSLDYFYLGYRPYPGYGFIYDYPLGWGYSPWGYPYTHYGYNSPWHFSHDQSTDWRAYTGNCSHHSHCRQNNNDGPTGEDGQDEEDIRGRDRDIGNKGRPPIRGYVSTVPTGHLGNQGMVVRNREGAKNGKNRLEPADPVPTRQDSVAPSAPSTAFHPTAVSTPNTFSGNNSRPPSVYSPSGHQPSMSSRSSRRRDRD